MTSYPQIFLRPSKLKALEGGHPWVLDKSIIEPTVPLAVGTIVDLTLPDGRFVARGIYNPVSRIRVRIYQWNAMRPLDDVWLIERLDIALSLRRKWRDAIGNVDAMRLVNSEGDGLSGLIIDRFGGCVVIQLAAAAMMDRLPIIQSWLTERFQPSCIWLRIDEHIAEMEGLPVGDRILQGELPSESMSIVEHGVRIQFSLVAGQKTGYYLDQRENRYAAAKWISGRMLDVCCYLGGFSLAAARWGSPTQILALDASRRALEQAELNAKLNLVDNITFRQGDCFEQLDQLSSAGERFDSVVLDPPKMAGNRKQTDAALRAYHRLNSCAMRLLVPGGILVSCSCSGRVSRDEFAHMLAVVASRTNKRVTIIEQRGAAPDHPVSLACPESEYLKCIICRVE